MARENLHDLLAFVAVAKERSFTRAAAQLGISQSTLSHTIRALEERLGLRLLMRTTRSVSTTEHGEQLLNSISPQFDQIESALSTLGDTREKPSGTIRITSTDYAANTILWPRLGKVLPAYPDIKVELSIDYALRDIVADRFDIGVRSGDQVAQDMIAVRLSPEQQWAVVASPAYMAGQRLPVTPQDLASLNCINLRLPTLGGLLPWALEKDGQEVRIRVQGQIIVGNAYQKLEAALAGFGLASLPQDVVRPYVERGQLVSMLEDWCPLSPGQFAYYPSRRQSSRALQVVIDALRYRAE